MNKELVQKLYFQATAICEQDKESSAWKFEMEFAKLIVEECISAYESDVSIYEEVNIVNILDHFGLEL